MICIPTEITKKPSSTAMSQSVMAAMSSSHAYLTAAGISDAVVAVADAADVVAVVVASVKGRMSGS